MTDCWPTLNTKYKVYHFPWAPVSWNTVCKQTQDSLKESLQWAPSSRLSIDSTLAGARQVRIPRAILFRCFFHVLRDRAPSGELLRSPPRPLKSLHFYTLGLLQLLHCNTLGPVLLLGVASVLLPAVASMVLLRAVASVMLLRAGASVTLLRAVASVVLLSGVASALLPGVAVVLLLGVAFAL